MITSFWGNSQDLWGLLLITVLIIIGTLITILWLKGPKYTKKVTKYIPLSFALIIVGILLSGGGLYKDSASEEFSTALNIQDNWIVFINDTAADFDTDGFWALWDPSWAQESYSSDMLRWSALIGSSFLIFYAGFTIDINLFKKYGLTAVLISFLPIFFEGTFFALLITPILHNQQNVLWTDFNWAIPFFIGYAIAAASPGIIVPLLIKFEQMGYGKWNKINEIAIICGSVDDITSLGLLLVFFSLVLKVQAGIGDDSSAGGIGSTFMILLVRIPVMLFLSIIVGFASYFLFLFYVKKPLDKFVPHETEIKGKKFKIWNILALMGLIFIIILVNEMCQHAEEMSLINIFAGEDRGFKSWIFPNGFLAFLVMGILLSSTFHKDLIKEDKKENIKTFMQWTPMVWLFIFAPLVFGSIGGFIIFEWIFKWLTLAYIVIVIFCIATGRTLGARLSLYNHEKFKWNDVGVIPVMGYPKGTTPAASTVFIGFLVYFATIANSANVILFTNLMLPLFKICVAAMIVTIPTNELVFNFYFKRYMRIAEEGKPPAPVPMPIFGKLNEYYKEKHYKNKK